MFSSYKLPVGSENNLLTINDDTVLKRCPNVQDLMSEMLDKIPEDVNGIACLNNEPIVVPFQEGAGN